MEKNKLQFFEESLSEALIKIHREAMLRQKKVIIDKACEWLFENVYDYLNPEDQEKVESFRKYLEE